MTFFEERLEIPAPQDRLFEFLLSPANLIRVSDPSSGLALVSAPDRVEQGSIVKFQIAAFGQVREMTHEITDVDHPERIVEVQRDGPMRSWRHTHHFESNGNGTILIEQVEFEPPGGLVGLLVTADKILDQLADGMFYKEQALRKLAERGEI